jgi:hypothetical protein
MAWGLKLDCPLTRPMTISTGLIGDRWEMKNAAVHPAKTTATNWASRLRAKSR